ncbi:hypothetical protein Tco_0888616 [Tanacetum coccineum]
MIDTEEDNKFVVVVVLATHVDTHEIVAVKMPIYVANSRTALKHLKVDRVKKFEYCLPEDMESQLDSTQTVSSLKLLMLKTGDYDLWSMWMEQYLTRIDYALWEVIVNGDAPAVASASTEGPIPPKTGEQKIARKNELKAKSTLLLAIPDEHLLKFYGIKDAKSLWEAIKD